MSDMGPGDQLRAYMAHTTGSETLHRHGIVKSFTYTDGILYMAEVCEAHWLIDLVMSHQPDVKLRLGEERDFQVWRLKWMWESEENAHAWVIEAWSDTPDESALLAKQEIPYSDFPQTLSPFEFYVEYGTMMLKEER